MKDILEYRDYRQYIADYYADRKAKSAFSWQEFAKTAGFSSPVYLKYVSEGRFNLSEEAAIRVAAAMSLVEYERDYFCEMVRFDHAKTDDEKKVFFNKMLAIADAHKVIADTLSYMGLDGTPILYGASVNPLNVGDIVAIRNVGGVLVGGASLKPQEFVTIIESAK